MNRLEELLIETRGQSGDIIELGHDTKTIAEELLLLLCKHKVRRRFFTVNPNRGAEQAWDCSEGQARRSSPKVSGFIRSTPLHIEPYFENVSLLVVYSGLPLFEETLAKYQDKLTPDGKVLIF